MPNIAETVTSSLANKRNSPLRKMVSQPVQAVTDVLHHSFPKLHPDHFTFGSVIGVAVACKLAYDSQRLDSKISKTAAVSILGGVQLGDAFDGSFARTMDRENPGSINFFTGGLKDVASDRIQEWFMAISRACIAHEKGNKPGECLAYFSAITNFLPSLAKAAVEANKGVCVPESGQGVLGLIGTRIGRAFAGTFSTVYPKIGFVPVQPIADAVTTFSNVKTSIERTNFLNQNVTPALPEKDIKEAKARLTLLSGLTVIGIVATLGVAAYQNKKINR